MEENKKSAEVQREEQEKQTKARESTKQKSDKDAISDIATAIFIQTNGQRRKEEIEYEIAEGYKDLQSIIEQEIFELKRNTADISTVNVMSSQIRRSAKNNYFNAVLNAEVHEIGTIVKDSAKEACKPFVEVEDVEKKSSETVKKEARYKKIDKFLEEQKLRDQEKEVRKNINKIKLEIQKRQEIYDKYFSKHEGLLEKVFGELSKEPEVKLVVEDYIKSLSVYVSNYKDDPTDIEAKYSLMKVLSSLTIPNNNSLNNHIVEVLEEIGLADEVFDRDEEGKIIFDPEKVKEYGKQAYIECYKGLGLAESEDMIQYLKESAETEFSDENLQKEFNLLLKTMKKTKKENTFWDIEVDSSNIRDYMENFSTFRKKFIEDPDNMMNKFNFLEELTYISSRNDKELNQIILDMVKGTELENIFEKDEQGNMIYSIGNLRGSYEETYKAFFGNEGNSTYSPLARHILDSNTKRWMETCVANTKAAELGAIGNYMQNFITYSEQYMSDQQNEDLKFQLLQEIAMASVVENQSVDNFIVEILKDAGLNDMLEVKENGEVSYNQAKIIAECRSRYVESMATSMELDEESLKALEESARSEYSIENFKRGFKILQRTFLPDNMNSKPVYKDLMEYVKGYSTRKELSATFLGEYENIKEDDLKKIYIDLGRKDFDTSKEYLLDLSEGDVERKDRLQILQKSLLEVAVTDSNMDFVSANIEEIVTLDLNVSRQFLKEFLDQNKGNLTPREQLNIHQIQKAIERQRKLENKKSEPSKEDFHKELKKAFLKKGDEFDGTIAHFARANLRETQNFLKEFIAEENGEKFGNQILAMQATIRMVQKEKLEKIVSQKDLSDKDYQEQVTDLVKINPKAASEFFKEYLKSGKTVDDNGKKLVLLKEIIDQSLGVKGADKATPVDNKKDSNFLRVENLEITDFIEEIPPLVTGRENGNISRNSESPKKKIQAIDEDTER